MPGRTLSEALSLLFAHTRPISDTETVGLWYAMDRVLAEPACACYDYPPFSRSAVDGYALRSADITEASPDTPVTLTVIDEICAGQVSGHVVAPGTAIRIMTGAPVPEGADCVLMQERTERVSREGDFAEGEGVKVYAALPAGRNICRRGEDYIAGSRLLEEGTHLRSGEIAILAGLGRDEIRVYRRPRVGLLTTGDETVLPGEPLPPGKVYDSNLYTVGTALRSFGAEPIGCESAPDDAAAVADRLRALSEDADLLVTTGGVSVGKKDILHEVLPLLPAERLFWKISMKPGMPTLCGTFRGKLVICLSGNPYGVFVGTHLLVRPVIARLSRREDLISETRRAVLRQDFPKASRVTRYLRGTLQEDGVYLTDGSQDSGNLRSLRGCSCLVEIPGGTDRLDRGAEVSVIPI